VSPVGAFLRNKEKKQKILVAFIFTRGLRHHRYPCVALRAFNYKVSPKIANRITNFCKWHIAVTIENP